MDKPMVLSGDSNVPAMPMTEAEVNHLRRVLAWMRCEHTLDDDMQRGYLLGAHASVVQGFATTEAASAIVQEKADQINRVPAYIRQGVKMLTKALREHEKRSGVVDSSDESPCSSRGAFKSIFTSKQREDARKEWQDAIAKQSP